MGMTRRLTWYLSSFQGSLSLFGTVAQLGEMPTLVKIHASDTTTLANGLSGVSGHVPNYLKEREKKNKEKE